MRTRTQIFLLSMMLANTALANVVSFSSPALTTTIPDADLNGIQHSLMVGGLEGYITDVNVSINISGGFNGDLYGFLGFSDSSVVLLNRAGLSELDSVGYFDAGMDITFDDNAATDLHDYRTETFTLNDEGQLTGIWQPDGRTIDPLSPGSSFTGAMREGLHTFDNMHPNGTWTLYLADVSGGSESTLRNWNLSITTIPEPSTTLLGLLALTVFVCLKSFRKCRLA